MTSTIDYSTADNTNAPYTGAITTIASDLAHKWRDDENSNLGTSFNVSMGVINILLGAQAVSLNLIVVIFYLTAKRIRSNVVPAMYLMMSGCDLVTGTYRRDLVIDDKRTGVI